MNCARFFALDENGNAPHLKWTIVRVHWLVNILRHWYWEEEHCKYNFFLPLTPIQTGQKGIKSLTEAEIWRCRELGTSKLQACIFVQPLKPVLEEYKMQMLWFSVISYPLCILYEGLWNQEAWRWRIDVWIWLSLEKGKITVVNGKQSGRCICYSIRRQYTAQSEIGYLWLRLWIRCRSQWWVEQLQRENFLGAFCTILHVEMRGKEKQDCFSFRSKVLGCFWSYHLRAYWNLMFRHGEIFSEMLHFLSSLTKHRHSRLWEWP